MINKLEKKIKRKEYKGNNKKKKLVYYFIVILFMSLFMFSVCTKDAKAIDVHDDPKNDVYRITVLDLLYVLGDDYPDIPHDVDDFVEVINQLITRSDEVDDPDCIDIDTAEVHHGVLNEFLEIDMEDDIDTCDYVYILVIIESDNNWVGMSMEYDEGEEEFRYESKNDIDDDNATGDFTGNIAWIAFNTTAHYYRESDDLVVLSITGNPDFGDFLHSYIYYDFCPNSEIEDENLVGSYSGKELITQFLDDIADFLFGWLFDGALSFLILMLLLIMLGQILFDRFNVWVHYIGFGLMAVMLYPIIVYMISISLIGVMGLPNILGIIEICILGQFLAFILLSWVNALGIIKKYTIPIVSALISMNLEHIIYMCLIMSSFQIIALIVLIIGSIGIIVGLIYSKKLGRNKFV